MKRTILILSVAAVLTGGLVGLTSCQSTQTPLRLVPTTPPSAEDYETVLKRWTRSHKLYNMLETLMFVSATFHSPEFRQAFLVRHPNVYGRGSEEARRLALHDSSAEENLEFFFSAYTAEIKWNDFNKEDSIWRVTLEGARGESVEGEVVRLKKTANLMAIYPFVTHFARTYAVRFPRTDANGDLVISPRSDKFTLKISSALGEADMVWELEPMIGAGTLTATTPAAL